MAYTIAFFGTKPYDESSFNDKNIEFGFEIRYYKGHLNKNNVLLTQGVDAVCIFVNDVADAEVIRIMAENGVKLLALRCAGFNNVDLNAAATAGITVVRVPAYSPYAVAEYTVALMLSLNRKIPRASWRTKDGNFSLHGLMGFDMHGKVWMFSHLIDDEDIVFMQHEFISYKQAMDYYELGYKPIVRLSHKAGAVYKIGKKVLIKRSTFEKYLRENIRREKEEWEKLYQ